MRLIARMLKCEYILVLNAPACGMLLNSSGNNLHLGRKHRLKIGFLLKHVFEFFEFLSKQKKRKKKKSVILAFNDILAVKFSKLSK